MARRLVVDADAAGADAARDAAILDAADRGVVTSASVVANGATAEAFVKAALARPRLGLGLHLNLVEGRPLAGRSFTLVGAGGLFPGDPRVVWKRAVEGHVDPQEVERETVAQWRRLVALGAAPDHLDSRAHVHVLPGFLDGVVRALEFLKADVHVRVPAEEDPPPDASPVIEPGMPLGTVVISAARLRQARAGHGGLASLGAHADAARVALRPPLWTSAGFAGLALATDPGPFLLAAALASAKGDVVELMLAAGRSAETVPAGPDPRAAKALALLSTPAAREAVRAAGFELSTFAAARG